MMAFIIEHKVAILIASEVIFWLFVGLALILRYWFQLKKASLIAFIIVIINEIAVFLIGVFDYLDTGAFSSFQILIIVFVLYSLIFGKKDFQKLDHWIQKKVARLKGESLPVFEDDPKQNLFGKAHAKMERKHFYQHLIFFIAAHLACAIIFGFVPSSVLSFSMPEWVKALDLGIVKTDNINIFSGISSLWAKILLIDFIWSFSYTIWPKKEKADRKNAS
ncbi:hypothetical protein [Camelliibacillus cellulosilyticus]